MSDFFNWWRRPGRGRDTALAACLLAGLVGLYLITYQGSLRSGDESYLMAGAQSLGRLGDLHLGAVFGDRGQQPFEVEPGQALVGALLDRWAGWAGVGSAHTLFLLNVYATALTAVAVFGLVRQHGFAAGIALTAGLAYGLATMAWPHTKFYFRDPLAVAWMMFGVWSCEAALSRRGWAGQAGLWLLGLALLAAGVATKQTTVFVAIAVVLSAGARALAGGGERRAARVALAVTAALGALTLVVPPEGVLGRLSAWRYFGLLTDLAGRPPSAFFGEAVAGMLVSPGKGLFPEAPVLILALAAVPLTPRSAWPRLITPWAGLLLLVMAVPLYRDYIWWGGVGWGVRHVLPAVPLLAAASAPAWQAAGAARGRAARWAIGLLLALSVLIQVGAVAGSLSDYYAALTEAGAGVAWTAAIWNWRYSEVVGYWQTLLAGKPWTFAWVRLAAVRPVWMIGGTLAALTGLVGLAALLGRRLLRAEARRAGLAALALAAVAVSVLPYGFLRVIYPDPDYSAWREDFRAAVDVVANQARPGDVVLVRGYLHPLWSFTLNYGRWPAPWYAYSPETPGPEATAALRADQTPDQAIRDDLRALFTERLAGSYERLWLVNDQGAPAGDLRLEAWWLAERVVPVKTEGELTTVTQFELVTPQPGDLQPAAITFGPALRLVEWGALTQGRAGFEPGEVLPLALRWQAAATPGADDNVGVYLLDAAGGVAAQRDSQPVNGFRPMTSWRPGETVLDLHGLVLPADLAAGEYRVMLAVYDWRSVQRLPAAGPAGAFTDDLALLGSIVVTAP